LWCLLTLGTRQQEKGYPAKGLDPIFRWCWASYLKFIPLISADNSSFLSYHFLPSPLLGITLKTQGSFPWK
jgi:hypothetical protein